MKFAFSTASVPTWTIAEAIDRAKAMNFDGIELTGSPPADIAQAARDAGIDIACLATPTAYRGQPTDDCVSRGVIESAIDTAQALGCRHVRMLDVIPGRETDIIGFGTFLKPLADYALAHDVTLLIENALTLRTARALWSVLDPLQHPAVAACWNLQSATAAGETPHVSVPVLNSRIRYVRVPATTPATAELPTRLLLDRLRGIGYQGYVCVGYGEAGESSLSDTLKQLRDWTRPPAAPKTKPAPHALKPPPAAKSAP